METTVARCPLPVVIQIAVLLAASWVFVYCFAIAFEWICNAANICTEIISYIVFRKHYEEAERSHIREGIERTKLRLD